jgi:hypothetical protein
MKNWMIPTVLRFRAKKERALERIVNRVKKRAIAGRRHHGEPMEVEL